MTIIVLTPSLCDGAVLKRENAADDDDEDRGPETGYISTTARIYEAFELVQVDGIATYAPKLILEGRAEPSPDERQALARSVRSSSIIGRAVISGQPTIELLHGLGRSLARSFQERGSCLSVFGDDDGAEGIWLPRHIPVQSPNTINGLQESVLPPSVDDGHGSGDSAATPRALISSHHNNETTGGGTSGLPFPAPLRCIGPTIPASVMTTDTPADDVVIECFINGQQTTVAFRPAVFCTLARRSGTDLVTLVVGRGLIARTRSHDEAGVERQLYQPLRSALGNLSDPAWRQLDCEATDLVVPSSREHIVRPIEEALNSLSSDLEATIIAPSATSTQDVIGLH